MVKGDGYSSEQADLDRYLTALHENSKTNRLDVQAVDDAFRSCFTKVKMEGKNPVIYLDNKPFRSYKQASAYVMSDDRSTFVMQTTIGRKRKGDSHTARMEGSRTNKVAALAIDDQKSCGDSVMQAMVQGDDDCIMAALDIANIKPVNDTFGAVVHAVACNNNDNILQRCIPRVHYEQLKGMVDHQLRLAVHIGVHMSDARIVSPLRADGVLCFDALERIWRDSKLMTPEYLWALLWALRFECTLDPSNFVNEKDVKEDARIACECVGASAANLSFGAHLYAVYNNPDILAPPSFLGDVSWMLGSRLQHAMYLGRYLCNERMACPFDAEGKLLKKVLAELWRCEKRFGAEHLWEVLWGAQDDYSREDAATAAAAVVAEVDAAAAVCDKNQSQDESISQGESHSQDDETETI